MPTLGNLVIGIVLAIVYLLLLVGGTGMAVVGLKRVVVAGRILFRGPTGSENLTAGEWALVEGTVRTGASGTVEAPLSGRDAVCVGCYVQVVRRMLNSTGWRTDIESIVGAPFRIVGENGTTRVDPDDAEVVVGRDRTVHIPSLSGSPERIEAFASAFDDTDDLPRRQDIRYLERTISVGDTVVAYGPVSGRDGVATLGGEDRITLTTRSRRRRAGDELRSATGFLAGGLVLLSMPGLFTVFFLLPYFLGP